MPGETWSVLPTLAVPVMRRLDGGLERASGGGARSRCSSGRRPRSPDFLPVTRSEIALPKSSTVRVYVVSVAPEMLAPLRSHW